MERKTIKWKKKRKRTRKQTMIYRTRQRNLKIVQHEHTKTKPKKPPKNQQTKRVNLGAPEGWAVPAPVVALVLLLLSAVATINNQILKSKKCCWHGNRCVKFHESSQK